MSLTPIAKGLYRVPLGPSNAFLLDSSAVNSAEGLTLIDTGVPGKEKEILNAIVTLGRKPADLRQIILTHAHVDHIGSAGALQRLTGATVFVHSTDAEIVRSGRGFRPMQAAPGIKNKLIFSLVRLLVVRRHPSVEPAFVEQTISDGQILDVAGGLQVIHVPGHCAGQVALLWEQHGGILIAGDACSNQGELSLSIGYENIAQGRIDLRRLSLLRFEKACFGHGSEIQEAAASKFRAAFG